MDKLRIAFFTYATKPRGSVVHTVELGEALQKLGHHVCIYALDKDGLGFQRPIGCDYQLIPVQPPAQTIDALIQQRIYEFINYLESVQLDYHVYHAQDCISANALATLREAAKIPHFLRTVHHLEDYNSPYLQQCQDRSIRNATLCLCVSQTWQTQLQNHYHLHAPRVFNGINQQRFSAHCDGSEIQLKQRLGLTGFPIYLTVGGIEPRKNSLKLLEAFVEVLADYPEAQLVISGGATLFDYQAYREEFFRRAEAYQLKIGESLIIPGVIPHAELPVLYRCADAFVFPSIKEGWGLVILEAIASGLPVITANFPPFTEFLTPEQALLVDPYSVPELAKAMSLITQTSVANSLRQNCQNLANHFSWESSAKIHLDHYYQLLYA